MTDYDEEYLKFAMLAMIDGLIAEASTPAWAKYWRQRRAWWQRR